jgi:Tetratricopeptide repeat
MSSVEGPAKPRWWRLARSGFVGGVAAFGLLCSIPLVHAQTPAPEQNQLFQKMLRDPKNIEITFAYVKVATANGDYEAAIGALERILFYQPGLARVKYELGSLYFRLGSYEMARRYFREALASPDIDPITKDRVEASLPDTEKQLQQNRVSGFMNTGIRYQTNANYAPSSGLVSLGGQELALLPSATKKSDSNWFGITGISDDYDLNNQRGDTLETRFVGYVTEQERFSNLDVGLFDLSFGPRLALAPDLLPGATIKPYIVGGNTWLGGTSYLASGGAGISASFPVGTRFTIVPDFEWRRVDVNTGDVLPISTFNSGDWLTTGLAVSTKIGEQMSLQAGGIYRRSESPLDFNSYDQWEGEAALTYSFAPPFSSISHNWSVSPFARLIRTAFDAANPFIDPTTVRRDNEWITGIAVDMPLTKTFGISTIIQYDHTDSTLPNYGQDNLSVMVGPTARF